MSNFYFSLHSAQKERGTKIVTLNGELDGSKKDEFQKLSDTLLLDDLSQYFIFDLTYLEYMNSHAVADILTLYNSLKEKNKKLAFVHANGHIKDVIDVLGISNIIPCYDSIEDAL